jgi:hypothetical protein
MTITSNGIDPTLISVRGFEKRINTSLTTTTTTSDGEQELE